MNRSTLVAALVAAVALSGCSNVADRISQVQQEAGKAMLPQIAVGECTDLSFADDAASEVNEIVKVDCAQPHKYEAYAAKQIDLKGEYPGDGGVLAISDDFCVDAFEGYVGSAADDSELDMTYIYPTADGWTQLNDRTITCFVGSEDGGITGTVKGSHR